MLGEKYLTKKYMRDKYYGYDKNKVLVNKISFVDFLISIESEFYNHDFNVDDRYQCVGRHRILLDEMAELYYSKEDCASNHLDVCPTVWCLDSLIEMFSQPNFLSMGDCEKLVNCNTIYSNKNINECKMIYDSYNKDDIISLNERDYILHALNMIKDSLKKCNNDLKWEENNNLNPVIDSVINDSDDEYILKVELREIISKLINKSMVLNVGEEFTIAKLLESSNEEVALIEPIVQGIVLNNFLTVCSKLNLEINRVSDEIGGLAYHVRLKKIS